MIKRMIIPFPYDSGKNVLLEDEDAKDAVNQSSDIVTGFKILRDILNAQD